jgi:Methyltransferase domain
MREQSRVTYVTDEVDLVLAENHELRRENRLLREQVEAFQASRWWRLHPRFLLRRRSESSSQHAHERASGRPPDTTAGAAAESFLQAVADALSVSRDTFTDRIDDLDPIVATLAGRGARVLEIGSYEGMSACYFLWRLPDAHVTCIDTFRGGIDDRDASLHPRLEEVFDRNVACVDATRVTKIVDDSRVALLELQSRDAHFDLVYIDGSHLALDVMVDAALSWRLVPNGGVILFDDYQWNDLGEDKLLRPGPAIDAVLELLSGKYELLHSGAQLAIRKAVETG